MSELHARLEDSFAALFEASLDGVLILDSSGVVVDANPAALALFGVERDGLVGGTTARFFANHPPRSDSAATSRLPSTEQGALRVEAEVVRPDGSRREVEVVSRAGVLGPGAGEHSLSIVRDISDRRSAERAREHSEERFAKAFAASPVPIAIVRASDGRYIDVNEAFLELVARTRPALIGRSALEAGILDGPTVASLRAHVARGLSLREFEHDVRRPSGEVRHVLASTEAIEIGGEPCRLAVLHDVTERERAHRESERLTVDLQRELSDRKRAEAELRRTEEQLRHMQKMDAIGSLAGGIAHDFNNLLSVIRGQVDLVLEDLPTDSTVRQDLEEIRVASNRAAELTRPGRARAEGA